MKNSYWKEEKRWKKGIERTLLFWHGKLPSKANQFNHPFPLPAYFGEMIGDEKEVSIADLGAGVVATTGNTWEGVKIDLHPSDLFADEFAKEYEYWGITPLFPIEKQDMEHLTYGDETFDIVHCVNALDHCVHPYQAISEMLRICKKGGWIYLRHYRNEGLGKKYTLMHQWNICKENEDCRIWNDSHSFLLSMLDTRFDTANKKIAEFDKRFDTLDLTKVTNNLDVVVSTLHKI